MNENFYGELCQRKQFMNRIRGRDYLPAAISDAFHRSKYRRMIRDDHLDTEVDGFLHDRLGEIVREENVFNVPRCRRLDEQSDIVPGLRERDVSEIIHRLDDALQRDSTGDSGHV